jgi:hypothetical protein
MDGKARAAQTEVLKELKEVDRQERLTIGGFATDGDAGVDALHEEQHHPNMKAFIENASVIPLKQHHDPMSDVPHLLKRAIAC